jgi:ribonuclease VapC
MITSGTNPRWPEDVEIDDHEGVGLPIASVVRSDVGSTRRWKRPGPAMSAASYLETAIMIDDRFGYDGARALKLFVTEAEIAIEPVSWSSRKSREAYRRFGRGEHPTALNFGDCFACALARLTREPLLFKGNDFTETDRQPC